MSNADFLTTLDASLGQAREALGRMVDRTEALAELWNRAVSVQAEIPYPVDVDDLRADATRRGELELAELEAIFDRAAKETP